MKNISTERVLDPQEAVVTARFYREEASFHREQGNHGLAAMMLYLYESTIGVTIKYLGNTMNRLGLPCAGNVTALIGSGESGHVLSLADTAIWANVKEIKNTITAAEKVMLDSGRAPLTATEKETIVKNIEKLRIEDANKAMVEWIKYKGMQGELFTSVDRNNLIPAIVAETQKDPFTVVRRVIVGICERSSITAALERLAVLLPVMHSGERERFVKESIIMFAKDINLWSGGREKNDEGRSIFIPLAGNAEREIRGSAVRRELEALNAMKEDKQNLSVAGYLITKFIPKGGIDKNERARLMDLYRTNPDPGYNS